MEPNPFEPDFAAPVQNPFGIGGNFSRSFPALADLDNDGDLDLMLCDAYSSNGGPYYGIFQYFENTGTPKKPNFSSPVASPFGLGTANYYRGFTSTFTDIDNDGDLDMIGGDYYLFSNNGLIKLNYWQNTGTVDAPAFATRIEPNFITYSHYYAKPTSGDLDKDSDIDLLIGDTVDGNDQLLFLQNNGSKSSPNFNTQDSTFISAGPIPQKPAPRLIDLDGDGDLDILVGDIYGNFHYFENSGTKSSPAFKSPVENGFGLQDTDTGTDQSAFLALGDMDTDGDLDLFVGENTIYLGTSNLWYFENKAR